MACCALAVFIICNVVLFAQRLRARLAGAPVAAPQRSAAATWAPGSSSAIRTATPQRCRWRRPALMALGLGFVATTVAAIAALPVRSVIPASLTPFVERADSTLCGDIRRLSRTAEPGAAASRGR